MPRSIASWMTGALGAALAGLIGVAAAEAQPANPPKPSPPAAELDWPVWKAHVIYQEKGRDREKQIEASYEISASGAPRGGSVRFSYLQRRADGTTWSAASTVVFDSLEQLWGVVGSDQSPGKGSGRRLGDGGRLTALELPVIWLKTEGGQQLVLGAQDIAIGLTAEYPGNESVVIEGSMGEQAQSDRDEKLDQLEREGVAMAEKMLKGLGSMVPPEARTAPSNAGRKPAAPRSGSIDQMAREAQEFYERGVTKTLPKLQGDTFQGSRHWNDERNDETVSHALSWRFQLLPEEVEAVLIPVGRDEGREVAYEQWLPKAGDDEQAPGNILEVRVVLKPKQGPAVSSRHRARFKFELLTGAGTKNEKKGASREQGICLNEPGKTRATDDHDLKIHRAENTEFASIAPDGQSAETKKGLREAEIVIRAHDYGAYGELRVVAHLDDGKHKPIRARWEKRKEPAELTIPLDENGNRIADAWEREWKIRGRDLPPDWDGADLPQGQRAAGDGISLYEKYRGFMFASGHERLDPHHKHLFVYDEDGLVRFPHSEPVLRSVSFESVSGIRVRYITPATPHRWTGPGSAARGRRVVNFNHGWGHWVDQHALHVVESKQRLWPEGWHQVALPGVSRARLQELISGFVEGTHWGFMFPDGAAGQPSGSPKTAYQIRIYESEIDAFLKGWANRSVCPQFDDCRTKADEVAKDAFLAQYRDQHPGEFFKRLFLLRAFAVAHEMGHGVGLDHHEPDSTSGDKQCVMRYLRPGTDCRIGPHDPYLAACYRGIPDRISRETAFSCAGFESCWKGVIVTDREQSPP